MSNQSDRLPLRTIATTKVESGSLHAVRSALRRVVRNPQAPQTTLTFRFSQDDALGMTLSAKNPFSRTVKYDLFVVSKAALLCSATSRDT